MFSIPIFSPSDNNYVPYLATSIASICHNTKCFCEFYILDGGINTENKEKIIEMQERFQNFSVEFLYINTVEKFSKFSLPDKRINYSTYMRLLIPQLKPDLEKIIYIDSDTIVLGDIKELYKHSLEEYFIGAIWNKKRDAFNSDTKEPMELSENYKYFNAGVLLIDIQKWIKDDVVEKLFEIEKKYRDKIPHADESILNKYFDNNYKILDLKYNVMDWDFIFNDVDEVFIRHYATNNKPWMLNPEVFKKGFYNTLNEFWEYAKLTPFYDELYEKVSNIQEQKNIFRKLQLEKVIKRMNFEDISRLKSLKNEVIKQNEKNINSRV